MMIRVAALLTVLLGMGVPIFAQDSAQTPQKEPSPQAQNENSPPVVDFPGADQKQTDQGSAKHTAGQKEKSEKTEVVVPGYVPGVANYGANYFYPYYAYYPGYVYPAYSYTPISPVAYPVYGYYPYYYGYYASPYYPAGYAYGYVPYATYYPAGYYNYYPAYPAVGWYAGYGWPMYMGW